MLDQVELLTQLRSYGLIRVLANLECRLNDDHSELFRALSTILNKNDAPPIDLYAEDALVELKGTRFFFVQQMLCELIPLLNVDQEDLLTFITQLIDKGGDDLTANKPSAAFGEWTKQNPTRSTKFYETVRTGNKRALHQLFAVLKANEDIDEALNFALASEKIAKLAAISALSVMELGERCNEVFTALFNGASSGDENIAFRALEAAYKVSAKRKVCSLLCFDEQLERVLLTRSAEAIDLATRLLWLHPEGLTDEVIDLCFSVVVYVEPQYIEIISHLDYALCQFVKDGLTKKVIDLLCEVVERSKGEISLNAFNSTYNALKYNGADVLGDAVVCWLFNGGRYIRKCLADKICALENETPPFSISATSLPKDPLDQLFLCRKAIGWLFIDPLAAIEIPLAVLRDGSSDIARDVLDLIYDPLLISYGDRLQSYLKCCVTDLGVNGSDITQLLAQKTEFRDALNGIESLVELHPSEMQREAEYAQWNEEGRVIELERQKPIYEEFFLVKHLLYGRSSLKPFRTRDGATVFDELNMTHISISSELPLLSIVDPVGLEKILCQLKFEPRETI